MQLMSAALILGLDNDKVVEKLAQALTVSFHFISDEKLQPIFQKLDAINKDIKTANEQVTVVEKENVNLKKQNDSLNEQVNLLICKVNVIEQNGYKDIVVINGIAETYAE